jgi:hypothetical protein
LNSCPSSRFRNSWSDPTRHSRFKKGQSGNPKGRPKASESFARLARRTCNERIVIKENGERRTIAKLQAAMKQLINKAASGDARAIREVFKLQAVIAVHDKSADEKVVVNIVRWADPSE